MAIKSVGDGAKTGVKAIGLGKQAAAAIKKEVPTAWAAGKTKLMDLNQKVVRPKTEPIARAVAKNVLRPALDKAERVKNAVVKRIESPDNKYIQNYKKDRLKVHFKEAIHQPVTLKRTVAEPPRAGDKQAQAKQLLARITAPKAPNPGPKPGKRPTK